MYGVKGGITIKIRITIRKRIKSRSKSKSRRRGTRKCNTCNEMITPFGTPFAQIARL